MSGSGAFSRTNTASSRATSNGGAAVPEYRTLSDMLAKGEIDALLSARAPSCLLNGAANVGRMFPDYRAVEEAYFRKTRIFPIMHAVGIRRSLVERHPWLAVSVYKAF